MQLPDSLCYVSFRRYSPLSLENVKKTTKVYSFWASNFFREGRLQFYGSLLARFTCCGLAKFGWVPFTYLSSAKLGNEAECRICGRWVKWRFCYRRLWTKVHKILVLRRGPLYFSTSFLDYLHETFRTCDRFWLSSVCLVAPRIADKNCRKKERKKITGAKHKADADYARRPN